MAKKPSRAEEELKWANTHTAKEAGLKVCPHMSGCSLDPQGREAWHTAICQGPSCMFWHWMPVRRDPLTGEMLDQGDAHRGRCGLVRA